MDKVEIFKTVFWRVSHRLDSRYPGYLIAASCENVGEIHELSIGALAELGSILQTSETILNFEYSPYKVIMAKLGFSKGFSCHFHILPVTSVLLQEIMKHPKYSNNEPDGVDAMLFASREYCEKELSQKEIDDMISVVTRLRIIHRNLKKAVS